MFDSSAEYAFHDQILIFDSLTGGMARRVSVSEWVEASGFSGASGIGGLSGVAAIHTCAPSPDGSRAILVASYRPDVSVEPEYALLMLDLSTLEYAPILSDNMTTMPIHLLGVGSYASVNVLEWATADTVLMQDPLRNLQAFRLTEE